MFDALYRHAHRRLHPAAERVSVVPVGGANIFTRELPCADPQAPTLVLVHGLGLSGLLFGPLLQQLEGRARVLVPDLPGFGLSDKPDEPYDLHQLSAALSRWAVELDLQPDAYLGHSLGAQIVGHVLLHEEATVPAAVAVAPTRDPDAPRMVDQGWRLLRDIPREPWSQVALAPVDYARGGLGRIVQTMRDAVDTDVIDHAGEVTAPLLVIRGEHDPVVPREWAQRLAGAVASPPGLSRVHEVPGAAHGVSFTHPREVAEATLGFLADVRRVKDVRDGAAS